MLRLTFIIIMTLLLSGCGFKYGIDPSLIPTTTERITFHEYVDPYKPFEYVNLMYSDQSYRLPSSISKSCIDDNSILVMVTSYDDQAIWVLIGGDCRIIDEGNQVTLYRDVMASRYEVDLPKDMAVYDLLKIYYEFPEGYVAEDSIDYINYGYRIEHTGENIK